MTEVLEALIARVPPPSGDPDAPARALIFDSEFDQYRGVIAYVRVVDGPFRKGEAIRAMQAGTEAEIDDIGFFTPQMTSAEALHAGEVGYLITGIKDVTKLRVGDTLTTKRGPATEPLPGYREVKPMVFCGLFPIDSDDYRRAARRAREAVPQRRRAVLGAGDLGRARLRLPLRLPRPAAHGHRARAAGARVRPRAAGDDAERRVRGHAHRRRDDRGPQPHRPPRPDPCRGRPRALHPRHDPDPEGVHRPDDGALPGAARRPRRHALPVPRARAAQLRHAAGRDRARLLRPAEVAHARLRLARLRADRFSESDLVKLDILLAGDPVDALSMLVHRTRPTTRAGRWPSGCARRSRASCTTSRSRRRSARTSSRARRSRRSART